MFIINCPVVIYILAELTCACASVDTLYMKSPNLNLSRNANIIAIICVTVFNFPHIEAAITFPPFSTAISLYPDTINSLANTIIGIHDGIFPYSTSIISADNTKILSASGSKNLPNVVT